MPAACFQCDRAAAPADWSRRKWDVDRELHHAPTLRQNIQLRLEPLAAHLAPLLAPRSSDLVRIAAYAYAADLAVRRGGNADAVRRDWRRTLALAIPVSDPAFWRSKAVHEPLVEALSYVSDDTWEFAFTRAPPELRQLPIQPGDTTAHGEPDSVVLFSGGADSLCAAVDAIVNTQRRPILVSHRSSPLIASRQRQLVEALRIQVPAWSFPHIGCWIQQTAFSHPEPSQRARSFLYASLGAAVARTLGARDVFLADNGIVSLNVADNAQLVGALATRSTHPKFIYFFNVLMEALFDGRVRVTNPLAYRTRSETLALLAAAELAHLLSATTSCVNARAQDLAMPHCGRCSQCIDRRFGVLAAGLEAYDPAVGYALDIFRDELAEGPIRTMVVSFCRMAQQMLGLANDQAVLLRYPELSDAITPNDLDAGRTAADYIQLLRRHAANVARVLEDRFSALKNGLARGSLPEFSLLRLVAAPSTWGPPPPETVPASKDFEHSDDYTSVLLRDLPFELTALQASVVRLLHQAHQRGIRALRGPEMLQQLNTQQRRMRDVFRRSKAWRTLVIPGERKGTYRLNI